MFTTVEKERRAQLCVLLAIAKRRKKQHENMRRTNHLHAQHNFHVPRVFRVESIVPTLVRLRTQPTEFMSAGDAGHMVAAVCVRA